MINLGLPMLVTAPSEYPTIRMKGRDFRMTDSGLDWSRMHEDDNHFVAHTVIYTDIAAGRNYTVEAYAFVIQNSVDGAIIPRFLYINGKLISAYHWQLALESNPLFYRCDSPISAVSWALAHAEGLVGAMAFNDALI